MIGGYLRRKRAREKYREENARRTFAAYPPRLVVPEAAIQGEFRTWADTRIFALPD